MSNVSIESDPLFTLLTDALRAGPGSPQWSLAVEQIRAGGSDASELEALVQARENLAAGRAYRSVQAGPGFTRKLMKGIDESSNAAPGSVPTATWIAALAAVAIVTLLGTIAYLLIPSDTPAPGVEQLTNTYFASPEQSLSFGGALPTDWSPIGSLPLDTTRGLRTAGPSSKSTVGGGIYWTTPIMPDQPTAVEATLHVSRPVDDVTLQVFITDRPDFSNDRGSSSHELVWQMKGQASQVFLPNGLSNGQVDKSKDAKDRSVRIAFNRDVAVVDMSGKRLWAGPNQLSKDQPRYVGVRLIRTGGEKSDAVVVTGVRVLRP